jgi:hypothetical protein
MTKEKAADKVRRDIATMRFSDWNKLDNVETTFVGNLELKLAGVTNKRNEALEVIKGQIETVMRNASGYQDVWVHGAFLVDGLGSQVEFSI